MEENCGIIERMAARVETPDLTGAAERGRDIIAAPSRMAIVKLLLDDGPATRATIVERTGMSVAGCRVALDQLQEHGHVTRTGVRPLLFHANRPNVVNDLAAVLAWMLSGPQSPAE